MRRNRDRNREPEGETEDKDKVQKQRTRGRNRGILGRYRGLGVETDKVMKEKERVKKINRTGNDKNRKK